MRAIKSSTPTTAVEPVTSRKSALLLESPEDRLEVWRSISDAWKVAAREGDRNMSGLGISMTEFKILKILDESGSVTMTTLSSRTFLTQPAITVFVDKLENLGLVERKRSEEDRRVTEIKITRKGGSVFQEGYKLHSRFVKEFLSVLSDSECRQLNSAMRKLVREFQQKKNSNN